MVIDNNKGITIIYGVARIFDFDQLEPGSGDGTRKYCPETPSCLGYLLWDRESSPILLRGGADPSSTDWIVEIPVKTKRILIWWKFYQKETDNGNICIRDLSKERPAGGIPYLKVQSKEGKVLEPNCYFSSGSQFKQLIQLTKGG
jgi:hypothetical protein